MNVRHIVIFVVATLVLNFLPFEGSTASILDSAFRTPHSAHRGFAPETPTAFRIPHSALNTGDYTLTSILNPENIIGLEYDNTTNFLFVALRSGSVIVLNATTFSILSTFNNSKEFSTSLVFDPLKNELLIGDVTGRLNSREPFTGYPLWNVLPLNMTLRDILVTEDYIITNYEDGYVIFYNHTTKKAIETISFSYTLTSLEINDDKTKLLAGDLNGTVYIYSLSNRDQSLNFSASTSPISGLASKGNILYVAAGTSVTAWNMQTGTIISTLFTEPSSIEKLYFDYQNDLLFAGTTTGKIKMFDINTGRLLRDFQYHSNRITALFTVNNILFASSDSVELFAFDIHSGEIINSFNSHTSWVESVAYYNDKLASGSRDKNIVIYNLTTNQVERTITTPSIISVIQFSSNGTSIISAHWDGKLRIYNLSDGTLLTTINVTPGVAITAIQIFNNGSYIAVGTTIGTVKIFNLTNQTEVATLTGFVDSVTEILCSENELFASSSDKTLRVWNINNFSSAGIYTTDSSINSFTISNNTLLIAKGNGYIELLNRSTLLNVGLQKISGYGLTRIRTSPDNMRISIGNYIGELLVFDSNIKQTIAVNLHNSQLSALLWLNNTTLVTGGYDNRLYLVNGSSNDVVRSFKGHSSNITELLLNNVDPVTLSSNGELIFWNIFSLETQSKIETGYNISRGTTIDTQNELVLGLDNGTLLRYNTTTGSVIWNVKYHNSAVQSLQLSTDKTRLAVASYDENISVIDTVTGSLLRNITSVSSISKKIVITPDNQILIEARSTGTLIFYDFATGLKIRDLNYGLDIKTLDISPDGTRILLAGDNKIVILNTADGSILKSITQNENIFTVKYSSDANEFVSGAQSGKIIIWDAATYIPIQEIDEFSSSVQAIAIDDNSNFIYVLADNMVRIYTSELPVIALSNIVNNQENVPLGTSIDLTFTKLMNKSSVENSITLLPLFNYTFQWLNQQLRIIPEIDLSSETNYTLIINSSIAKDLTGNYLDGNRNRVEEFSPVDDFVITFRTEKDIYNPKVISVSPSGKGVNLDSNITIEFSERVNETSLVNGFRLTSGAMSWSLLNGTRSWSGKTFVFKPAFRFESNRTYTAELNASQVKDYVGNYLIANYSWNFTGEERPVIVPQPVIAYVNYSTNFTINVRDDTGVTAVTLYYKKENETNYTSTTLSIYNGSQLDGYYYTLIPPVNRSMVLPYYVEALDGSALLARYFSNLTVSYDKTPPVIIHTPLSINVTTGSEIEFNATVTDNTKVKTVSLHYRYPANKSYEVIQMKLYTENFYNVRLKVPETIGNLTYYISAEDEEGNVAVLPRNGTFSITVVDRKAPIVFADNQEAEVNENITIFARVADNIAIAQVLLSYREIDEYGYRTVEMGFDTNLMKYYVLLPPKSKITTLEYFITASDTSGNIVRSPESGHYLVFVNDTKPPEILNVIVPKNISVGLPIPIRVTAKDNYALGPAKVIFSFNNRSEQYAELPLIDDKNYSGNMPPIMETGTLNLSVHVFDSTGNHNQTGNYTVIIIPDNVSPEFNFDSVNYAIAGYNEPIEIEIIITDNIAVEKGYIYYRPPESTNFSMEILTSIGNNRFIVTLPPQTKLGFMSYYFTAVDINGNSNRSSNYTLQIKDIRAPTINIYTLPKTLERNSSLEIFADITDDISVKNALLIYRLSSETFDKQLTMVRIGNTTRYNALIPAQKTIGILRIWLNASDSSGNYRQSPELRISVVDTISPAPITNLRIELSENGDKVILKWAPSTSDDVVSYKIYRSMDNKNFAELAIIDEIAIEYIYVDEWIQTGKTYYYEVVAVDGAGLYSPAVKSSITVLKKTDYTPLLIIALIVGLLVVVLFIVLRFWLKPEEPEKVRKKKKKR